MRGPQLHSVFEVSDDFDRRTLPESITALLKHIMVKNAQR